MHLRRMLHDIAHDCANEPNPNQRVAAEALCTELRQLFCNDVDCFAQPLDVRVFGSVCNNTHLPTSDMDIAVIPTGCHVTVRPTKGPPQDTVCDVLKFRQTLLDYLKKHYGEHLACEQRKAILLCGEEHRTRADIVVLLPKLWQHGVCPKCGRSQWSSGYELRSSCERECMIATWPDQHRDNSHAYDSQTSQRYKRAVRAAKAILRSGIGNAPSIAHCIPPVLVENLFARVSPWVYANSGSCPYDVIRAVVNALQQAFWSGDAHRFRELSDKRDLFHTSQTWTYQQVRTSIFQLRSLLDG